MFKFFKNFFLSFLLLSILLSSSNSFALVDLDKIKVDTGDKTAVNIAKAAKYNTDLQATSIVNRVVQIILGLCSTLALVMIMLAGYNYLMSKGDPAKIKKANGEIITGVIGIALIILSYSISTFIIKELIKRSTVNSVAPVADECNVDNNNPSACFTHTGCQYNSDNTCSTKQN